MPLAAGAPHVPASVLPPPPNLPPVGWAFFSPDQWRYIAQLGQWFAAAYQASLLSQQGLSAQLNNFQGGAMSSFDDLTQTVSRIGNDVANVKSSIDQALTLLDQLGTLQPQQQQRLDQAVSQLSAAADTLETEQTALSGAANPPATPPAAAPPAPAPAPGTTPPAGAPPA